LVGKIDPNNPNIKKAGISANSNQTSNHDLKLNNLNSNNPNN
jgi:hypothetical protein